MMGFGLFFSKNIWTYDGSIYIQYDFLGCDFRDATLTNYNSVGLYYLQFVFLKLLTYSNLYFVSYQRSFKSPSRNLSLIIVKIKTFFGK